MKKQNFDAFYQTKYRQLIWHRGRLVGEVFTLPPRPQRWRKGKRLENIRI